MADAARLADEAAHGLARNRPELSAHIVIRGWQKFALVILLCGAATLTLELPGASWTALADLLSLLFLASAVFRATLALLSKPTRGSRAGTRDENLPVYAIIVPLYREANVLPRLARTLLLLDYPHDKLQILLVVEDDDLETLAVAQELVARGPFELICVPAGSPRTKPRACNYALNFARGEFTVIYDAEDRPERDQLRKAVAAFGSLPPNVACLQARLNFYNARENALTKLFALDYALWFDVLLPALDRLGVPMPLGGTSNHFRTPVLRRLGGWDPFNVTEDADLGIRIAQLGQRVAMLDSTTFEEAPVRIGVWLRQRSRWMKGYMQTWLVHTRQPFGLVKRAGPGGFLAFHLFIGGSVAGALATVPLWLVFLLSAVVGQHGPTTTSLCVFALGNLLLTALAVASPIRRGRHSLSPYGLAVPLYWAMISFAAWHGLGQLVTRPFHWEKTPHGLSQLRR
ncbi:MAG TPA: glycosyltransferase [Rhizomicrobium sp.]|nr:glycosyltransferase [Rhizomicrobium sp.]